jgi:transcription initiation factor IIE alpha subunit
MTLAFTISQSADAHTTHATDGQAQPRAENRARRPAKRRRKAQKQQAMYTCPMHHEIRSKTPGECPKCRMELELEETSAKTKSE